jgi:hypothetical protein
MQHHRGEHEETIITSSSLHTASNNVEREERKIKVLNRFNAEHIESVCAADERQKPFERRANEMQAPRKSILNAHKLFQRLVHRRRCSTFGIKVNTSRKFPFVVLKPLQQQRQFIKTN